MGIFLMCKKKCTLIYIFFLLFTVWSIGLTLEHKKLSEDDNEWKNIPVFLINETGKNKIDLKTGVTFGLLLRSNISTGFGWELKPGYEQKMVNFLGVTDHESDRTEIQRFGSAELEKFVFKSLLSGELEIEFIYCRPWEKEKEPEKRIPVKLIFKDK